MSETYLVKVKPDEAEKARPAIWYCEHGGKKLYVKKSKEYKGFYEVITGQHTGMIIEISSCELMNTIPFTNKS